MWSWLTKGANITEDSQRILRVLGCTRATAVLMAEVEFPIRNLALVSLLVSLVMFSEFCFNPGNGQSAQ